MTKTLIALAAFAAASQPAFADTITRDGVAYTYTVSQKGKTTVIAGSEVRSGRPFLLQVSGNWVNGTVGGQPVAFRTNEVVRAKAEPASTVVAAR